jgi:hypothetical protein
MLGGAAGTSGEAAGSSGEAAGSSGAGPRPRDPWEDVRWDTPRPGLIVYLWTGSPSNTWALFAAGGGAYARDHYDGSGWSSTLDPQGNEGRFEERQVWAAPSGQAFGSSDKSMQRFAAPRWQDWGLTPTCRAIGGTAENDIWCADDKELHHFDGKVWATYLLTGIRGIQALARDDVWAWGATGALHFDGARWITELLQTVRSLSASGPRDVWAVQDGNLLHSNGAGTRWGRQNPSGGQISAVWSQSPTNTWIVAAGAAMRWNGRSWSTPSLPESDELLLISGSSSDVWIAGTAMLFHGRTAAGDF